MTTVARRLAAATAAGAASALLATTTANHARAPRAATVFAAAPAQVPSAAAAVTRRFVVLYAEAAGGRLTPQGRRELRASCTPAVAGSLLEQPPEHLVAAGAIVRFAVRELDSFDVGVAATLRLGAVREPIVLAASLVAGRGWVVTALEPGVPTHQRGRAANRPPAL